MGVPFEMGPEMWLAHWALYLKEKNPDLCLYSNDGYKFQIHRDVFYQTKVMFDMLNALSSNQGVYELLIPVLNKKNWDFFVHFLYTGIIHPTDREKITFGILVKIFGFPEWMVNFKPENVGPSEFTKEIPEQEEPVIPTPSDEAQNFQELEQTDESPFEIGDSSPQHELGASFNQSGSKSGQNYDCRICNSKQKHEKSLYLHLIMFHYKDDAEMVAQGKDYVMEVYYRNYPNSTPMKQKRPFTQDEDLKIIHFVHEHKTIFNMKMWRNLVESKILPQRSSMTLKKRFFNSILPNIENYPLADPEKEFFGKILMIMQKVTSEKNEQDITVCK